MRMRSFVVAALAVLVAGCSQSSSGRFPIPSPDRARLPGGGSGEVVEVGKGKAKGAHAGPRGLKVPPGHYPPPGQCRLWYPGTPPGKQPKPAPCGQLRGRVPVGAFILYNSRAWDADYDWRRQERRNPGTVPEIILGLIRAGTR